MKIAIMLCTTVFVGVVYGQSKPLPFSEASKAMRFIENESERKDSLRSMYKGKWTLNVTYGQRFINPGNRTNTPDSITFADFSDRRSFYGLGTSYFISEKVSLSFGLDFSLLPKNQEVSNIIIGGPGGISVDVKGNGGLLIRASIGAKYFFSTWNFTRPYLGANVGVVNLIANGGEGRFNLSDGREENFNTLKSKVNFGQLITGISHRASPGILLDWQLGYSITTKTNPIGGITSTGGFSSTISIQFILNPGKK